MSDDIVARLRLYAQKQRETNSTVLGLLLSDSADEIERLRRERNQLRAEIVDRALGFTASVDWNIDSKQRMACETYARQRGWHDLWDDVNELERLMRERNGAVR